MSKPAACPLCEMPEILEHADRFVRKYNDILESYNCHWGYSTSYDKADECAEKIQKELKLDYFCIEATTGGKFRVSLPMKIQP